MNLVNSNDKRKFHRILFSAKASVNNQERHWDCEVIDLSLKGCLLRFADPWQEDLEQLFSFVLQLSDTCTITMELEVAHVVGNVAGFKCVHIDLQSISELRRLVELNLGDSELLERDLLALADLSGP
jgi:hypothetical protein